MNEPSNDSGASGAAVGGAIGAVVGGVAAAALVAQTQALIGQVGAAAVKVEVENLQTFKKRVDDLLSTLDSSAAGQGTISRQQLTPGQLGQDFGQAGDLMSSYTTVHANLDQLSRTLSMQIEAMSASIDMAARGYQNADAAQQEKFQSLLNRTGAQSQLPPAGGAQARAGQQQPGHPAAAPGSSVQQGSY
ncbi:hypothetical protein [Kitasatospora cineracea]|uniref:Uncharacterized protein n=1 Tax=Kitasatospora cineracea TaxID=88074 RepID=A0A3N4RMG5_9ACTN|nr:hypothetical protein [Kitasatospora cineracea]RPE34602.1 hypothetical protein EDD38_2924 [Kitasatospora cineracea]